jgi:hypothetical protein
LSIDFTGGTTWELSLPNYSEDKLKDVFAKNNLELKDFYLNTTLDIIHLKKKISSTIVKKEINENFKNNKIKIF